MLSFSAAKAIEGCPRRWWLERGDYSNFGVGYPAQVSASAMRGQILHRAIELYIRAARRMGVNLQTFPDRVRHYGFLGGSIWLSKIGDNLRAGLCQSLRLPDSSRLSLNVQRASDVLELEDSFASLLRDIDTPTVNLERQDTRGFERRDGLGHVNVASELADGLYEEQRIESDGWHGIIDLLKVTRDGAHIADFKSGAAREHHKEQLALYAALWLLDRKRNPSQLPVASLTLQYVSKQVSVEVPAFPPSELDNALKARRGTLGEMLNADLPTANLGDGCKFCPVRHMCEPYWRENLRPPFQDEAFERHGDVELQLSGNSGGSWMANLIVDGRPQARVEVPVSPPDGVQLKAKDILRVLDAERIDSSGRFIVRLTDRSEVHIIPAPDA
jgi:hypothetical protein